MTLLEVPTLACPGTPQAPLRGFCMCEYCVEASCFCSSVEKVQKGLYTPVPFQKGFVYFFATEDLTRIKIGFTEYDPHIRMKSFQKEERQKLIMIAMWPVESKRVERAIHKEFEFLRIDKRREWFVYHRSICGFLKESWFKFSCGMTCPYSEALWSVY